MKRGAIAACVMLALSCGAAPAQGKVVATLPPDVWDLIAFDWIPYGKGIAYYDSNGRRPRIRTVAGGRIRTISAFAPLFARGADEQRVTMAGTRTLIAVGHTRVEVTPGDGIEDDYEDPLDGAAQVLVGGRLRTLISCPRREVQVLAATDNAVAYSPALCGDRDSVGVWETSGRRSRFMPPAGRAFELVNQVDFRTVDLAGGHLAVAVARNGTNPNAFGVAVYDVRAERLAYHLDEEEIVEFAVQGDGKVAALQGSDRGSRACDHARVAWASPAQPSLRQTATGACDLDRPLIARDRVLYARSRGEIVTEPPDPGAPPGSWHLQEVVTTDLDGGDVRLLLGTASRARSYDGERVAYSTQTCFGASFSIDSVAGREASGPAPTERCSIRLVGARELALDDRNRMPVALRCKRGCRGFMRVWVPSRSRFLGFATGGQHANLDDLAPGRRHALLPQLSGTSARSIPDEGIAAELHLYVYQPGNTLELRREPVTLRDP